MNETHHHSRRSVLVAQWAIILVLTSVPQATARDVPLLPPPTGSAQLDRFADRLDLSGAQRSAWRRAHLDYQDEHRRQRATFIDQLEPLRQEIGEMPFHAADPGAVRRYYSIHQQAIEHLFAFDRGLFDALKPHLTEEQIARLPSIVAQHQRDAWLTVEMVHRWRRHEYVNFHGSRADLYDALAEAEIDSTARRELEAIVDRHTMRIEHALRELYRQTANLHRQWAQRVREESGGEEPSIPARAEPYIELAAPARRAYRRVLEQQHDALMAVLNAADTEMSWRVFVTVADRYATFAVTPPIRRFDRVIDRLRDVDEPGRELIEQHIASCRTAFISTFDAVSRVAIEQNSAHPPGIGPSAEALREMTASIPDMMESARNCVEAMIPDLHDDALVDAVRSVFSSGPVRAAAPDAEELSDRIQAQFQEDLTPDQFIAGPISREVVSRFADAVDLSADMRQVLELLHQDYQRSFMTIRRSEVDEAIRVFVGFRVGESGMGEFSPPEDVKRKHEARLAARKAIDELDRRFIEDASAVLDRESAKRRWLLKLLRAGEAWTRGTRRPARTAGDYVAFRAEPLTAILVSDLERDERQAAINAIEPHASKLISALRELYEAELAIEYADNRMTATMRKEEGREEAFAQWRSRRESAAITLREARRAVVERSLDSLEAIDDAVSPQTAEIVRESYVRMAFPSIYDDENAQHDRFKAALALRTLSGSQRDRLTDAWLKYQQAYRETSWKMVDAMSQPSLFGLTMSGDERTVISRMESVMDDLRLERQQLNDEAALSIETILTTSQHESLQQCEAWIPRTHTNGQ